MSLATVQLMSIMNEAKIVHGRELFPYIPPKLLDQMAKGLVKAGMFESEEEAMVNLKSDSGRLSIASSDVFNSVMQHEIENYDKDLDLMILRSEAIVETYNKVVEMKFKDAAETFQHKMAKWAQTHTGEGFENTADKPLINALEIAAGNLAQYAELPGIDVDELKKTMIQGSVYTSDDPEKIKRHIQMRINYNKTIIRMFQEMLKQNYQILGFSKDEALLLSQQMVSDNKEERSESIKTLKAAILANKKKFDRGNGFIDLRSIGAGVIFGTSKETGLDKFMSIDRMIQTSMRYDCILFGHGDSDPENTREIKNQIIDIEDKKAKLEKETHEKYDDLIEKIHKEMEASYTRIAEKYPDKTKYIKANIDDLEKIYTEDIERFRTRAKKIDEYRGVLYKRMRDNTMSFQDGKISKDEWMKNKDKLDKLADKAAEKYDLCTKTANALIHQFVKKQDELLDDYNKRGSLMDRYYEKKYASKAPGLSQFSEKLDQLDNELEKLRNEYMQAIEQGKASGAKFRWIIQPVSTEKAGPFTDMNDLVRQAIKEGYKKIMIVSCNPGHHELDPDIKKTKGVIINHSMNTLLAESVMSPMDDYDYDPFDPLDEASQTLFETEQHLVQVCNESGIDYWDDNLLNEAATMFEQDVERLNEEGIGRKVWTTVKELIKKAIGFLAKIIKGIISFFRGIIEKIKAFFAKIFGKSSKIEKPLRKEFKTAFIIVEAASVRNVSIKNWDDLQKNALESCNKIADKINKLERQQTELLKKTEQFAEQQERKAPQNENAYTSYTIEMLKRLAGI